MKSLNWYFILIFVVMMSVIGYFTFDNIASVIIFGIVVGGTFGCLFSSNKNKTNNTDREL